MYMNLVHNHVHTDIHKHLYDKVAIAL